MRTDPELAARLIEGALRAGAHSAEVYQRASESFKAEVRESKLDNAQTGRGFGYGLRVICDGRLGYSWSNRKEDSGHVIKSAMESAGLTMRDEFNCLPDVSPEATPALDIYDPQMEGLSEASVIDLAREVESAARAAEKRVVNVRSSSVSHNAGEVRITNSRGLDQSYRATSISSGITVMAEEGGDSRMGWGYETRRFLGEMDFAQVGKDAAERAVALLGSRKPTSANLPVLMDSSVAAEFLGELSSMFSADSVQKGRSAIKGKIGQRVFTESLDIIDDGLVLRGSASRPFDDEGVPVTRKYMVRKGVAEGLFHNSFTALKDGSASTGNALRSGYASLPSSGPIALTIESAGANLRSALSRQEAFKEMGRGLYVLEALGLHTINPVSGDFSVGVCGIWIEQGGPAYPVCEAVMGGNLIELFASVLALCDDIKAYGAVRTPSILFGRMDISA